MANRIAWLQRNGTSIRFLGLQPPELVILDQSQDRVGFRQRAIKFYRLKRRFLGHLEDDIGRLFVSLVANRNSVSSRHVRVGPGKRRISVDRLLKQPDTLTNIFDAPLLPQVPATKVHLICLEIIRRILSVCNRRFFFSS